MQAMPNNKKRPVFLNLIRIRQPATAVLSIGHRLSGIILVLMIPVVVFFIDVSLRSEQGYRYVADLLRGMPARVMLVAVIWFFAHHFLAGIRYLLIDVDVGSEIDQARFSAWLVFAGGLVVLVIAGAVLL